MKTKINTNTKWVSIEDLIKAPLKDLEKEVKKQSNSIDRIEEHLDTFVKNVSNKVKGLEERIGMLEHNQTSLFKEWWKHEKRTQKLERELGENNGDIERCWRSLERIYDRVEKVEKHSTELLKKVDFLEKQDTYNYANKIAEDALKMAKKQFGLSDATLGIDKKQPKYKVGDYIVFKTLDGSSKSGIIVKDRDFDNGYEVADMEGNKFYRMEWNIKPDSKYKSQPKYKVGDYVEYKIDLSIKKGIINFINPYGIYFISQRDRKNYSDVVSIT